MKNKIVIGLIGVVAIVAIATFVGCIENHTPSTPTPTTIPSPTATLTKTPAPPATEDIFSAESRVIRELRRKTELFIKDIGRPPQLYNIDKSKTTLIVVDMQNFICDQTDGHKIQGINTTIKNINRIVDVCHEEHIPVIWLRHNIHVDESGDDSGLYSRFHKTPLPKEITNLSHGTQIYKELNFKEAEDYQVCKNRYSAFIPGASRLDDTLKSLGRTQLIFTGVMANVCVESTVRDAMQLGYEVILVSDAIAAVDRVVLEVSLMNTRLFFGDVRDTATIIEDLKITF